MNKKKLSRVSVEVDFVKTGWCGEPMTKATISVMLSEGGEVPEKEIRRYTENVIKALHLAKSQEVAKTMRNIGEVAEVGLTLSYPDPRNGMEPGE